MRVLVTGSSGKLGQAVIANLLAHGHDPCGVDRVPAREPQTIPSREVNLTDVGQVMSAMRDCEAVIHLGAIPSPERHAPEVVFRNNTQSTFAVLHAASLLGIRRAVIASSLSALGIAWADKPFPPRYVPIDEGHPLLVRDPYGLSKEVNERTAEMIHRQTGMAIAALRFHWIVTLDEARAAAARLRTNPTQDDWDRWQWGYVGVRDAATACRLGIEAVNIGFAVCNITAADTLLAIPTEMVIRRHTPAVEIRQPIPGFTTPFSLDRARHVLGYVPRYSWRAGTATPAGEGDPSSSGK